MRIDREGFLLLAMSTLAACEPAEGSTPVAPEAFSAPGVAEPLRISTREIVQEPHAPPPPPLSPLQTWFLGLSSAQRDSVRGLCHERAVHPCAGLWRMLRRGGVDDDDRHAVPDEDLEAKYLASLGSRQGMIAGQYCVERSGMPAPTCETPLVVSLDNQPVEFTPSGDATFAFVPGTPMATAWPTAATPWIARDLDGDGAITSGAELFGSSTVIDGGVATNGFQALAALDANHDGAIDARDPAFAELVLWADRDGDHRSSPAELRPLSQVITSIPLAYTLDPRCVDSACEGERGVMRWRDPTGTDHTGAVIDIYVSRRRDK